MPWTSTVEMWPPSRRIAWLTMHHAALTPTMRLLLSTRLVLKCSAITITWQMMGLWEAAQSTTCKCVLTIPLSNTTARSGRSLLLLWMNFTRTTGTCTVRPMLVKLVLASTRLFGGFRTQTMNTLSSTSIWQTIMVGRGLNRTTRLLTHSQHCT